MTITDFERHIDRHGLDFAAWPPALVEPALDLLQTSPEAQDLYAARSALEEGEPNPGANAALAERLGKTVRDR